MRGERNYCGVNRSIYFFVGDTKSRCATISEKKKNKKGIHNKL
jgi:hypothetical protein